MTYGAGSACGSKAGRAVKPGCDGVIRAGADLAASRVIAKRSPRLLRLFGLFCTRDLGAFFHRIRLLGPLPRASGPLIFFANHPSWWDAELYIWLGTRVFRDRRGFAPMDAPNLERYGLLAHLGAFPVLPNTFAGASGFLATAERVLQEPDAFLLVAVEGRFRDVRVRPVHPMPGLAHLARRVPGATFVPLAIDYVFWSERRPNLLLHFGEPIGASELAAMPTAAAKARITAALETTMDTLAEAGQSRDPGRFTTLLKGRDSMNVLFDLWRRAQALMTGRPFQQAHRKEI